MEIIKETLLGFQQPAHAHIVPDREEAIHLAIRLSTSEDIVLIAGKGHENYQIFGKEKRHFSDSEEALKAIQRRFESA